MRKEKLNLINVSHSYLETVKETVKIEIEPTSQGKIVKMKLRMTLSYAGSKNSI